MSEFFLKIVNMSISASWLVLAVLLLRLVLKKAPKWVSVLLWGFVAVRLICPFSVESVLSLIPSAETISPEIMMDWTPEVSTGIGSLDTVVNPIISETFAPKPYASANPLQILIPLAAVAWIVGIAAMLLYTAVSYILLRRKVATAVLLRNNIYQSENVDSPFVLGIIKPKIYLPFQMDDQNLEHIIAHEESHIRRKDHWWKPFGFVLLAIHWFNPLMWLGYILLCRDIELACDEKVIKEMDNESKADYTQALVACSINRRSIAACPLAFGEVGVKERVKSVMNYKKPAFWIIVAAILACVAVAVCFLTNPMDRISLSKLKSDEINMPGILDDITGMVVTYEGISAACPEKADVNRFLATLDKINVSKEPVSLNRSEDRSKDFTIKINTNTELHFNKSFTEFWVDNHVKPSLSHRITNPETAKELLLDFNFTNSSVGGADGPTTTYTEVNLTDQVSDTQESSYEVSVFLPATDLSNPGQVLADKIANEWKTYDGMTQQQQWTSSHLWGVVYVNTETWNECEQAIGVAIDNPLETIDWINKTGYFGMESADPSTPVTHVQATAYATHSTDRNLGEISVTAGYNKGNVQITISATVSATAGTITTGGITRGYATFEHDTTTTGSGAPVLVVTTNETNNLGYYNGDYFDPTAYWVKDNVFYTLRVFGDEVDQAEIQETLELILAEI